MPQKVTPEKLVIFNIPEKVSEMKLFLTMVKNNLTAHSDIHFWRFSSFPIFTERAGKNAHHTFTEKLQATAIQIFFRIEIYIDFFPFQIQ